jgi:hypothetical protein
MVPSVYLLFVSLYPRFMLRARKKKKEREERESSCRMGD